MICKISGKASTLRWVNKMANENETAHDLNWHVKKVDDHIQNMIGKESPALDTKEKEALSISIDAVIDAIKDVIEDLR